MENKTRQLKRAEERKNAKIKEQQDKNFNKLPATKEELRFFMGEITKLFKNNMNEVVELYNEMKLQNYLLGRILVLKNVVTAEELNLFKTQIQKEIIQSIATQKGVSGGNNGQKE